MRLGMCSGGRANVFSFGGDVSTLAGDVSSFWANVFSFEGDVSTLAGDVSSFWANVFSFEGDVSTLAGDVSSFWRGALVGDGARTEGEIPPSASSGQASSGSGQALQGPSESHWGCGAGSVASEARGAGLVGVVGWTGAGDGGC